MPRKCFGIEPHLLLLIHVSKQHCLVLVGDIIPGGVTLAIPAKQVGKVALLIMTAEIHANIFLQFSFLGEGRVATVVVRIFLHGISML